VLNTTISYIALPKDMHGRTKKVYTSNEQTILQHSPPPLKIKQVNAASHACPSVSSNQLLYWPLIPPASFLPLLTHIYVPALTLVNKSSAPGLQQCFQLLLATNCYDSAHERRPTVQNRTKSEQRYLEKGKIFCTTQATFSIFHVWLNCAFLILVESSS
jgi:hypothetical protein